MQTIARANRVLPDKDNGLIVDCVGVLWRLERALATYATERPTADDDGSGVVSPIRPKDELTAELVEIVEYSDANDIDLHDLESSQCFEFIALQKPSVEALLIDEETRHRYLALARLVRETLKSLSPDHEGLP